jgi:regulatory subunit for Cdc7p protein kinase
LQQEERFFSRAVTHIVTSRPIPPEPENGSLSGSSEEANSNGQLRTIDPMLLDKSAGSLPRTYPAGQPGPNPKKEGNANLDVLSRGRQMGMKIWSLDKCQRVLTSILEDSPAHAPNTRGGHVSLATARAREEDLSQVLQNERLKNPSGREANSSLHDVALFKGPFIYIHDMDAKTRPIMVREYDRPAKRSEGTWPQFRSANVGKCPFIEDPVMKRELER